MSWILLCLVGFVFNLQQAHSTGVFELRLKLFDNEAGKDDLGKCCNGQPENSECNRSCHPRFRVCLKEYQVKIDTTSPCTFGDVTTTVFRPNSQDGFDTPIRISFPFAWPSTFSLIVEAWHVNGTTSSEVLISRLTRQRVLEIGEEWTDDLHKSKYTTLRFEYRVTCDPYYYGKGCAILCRPRNDTFGHFSCSPMGERVCLTGWTGDYCTKPKCSHGCDEQHGHCTKPDECKCQSGWEGPRCNQCQRYPGCMHGTCVKPWDCLCNEGWGGLFCNQDLNFCTNHKPCENNGTCFNTGQGSYTCSCPAGFTGKQCETAVDDCSRIPCYNGGTCSHNICTCPRGFHGPRCEISSQLCADRPCQNGGICRSTETGYQCTCPLGYSGSNCQQHLAKDCASNPCENDGTCVDGSNGFECICQSGFTGTACEINVDDCQGDPCLNGGTCIDSVNEFRCQCVPGFVGPLCQTRVDYCLAKPCANGGTCLKLTNDYKCICAASFIGKDCSIEIDKCQSSPCQNGATCVNRLHGFECHCQAGYLGRTCDETASSASPSARVSSESHFTTEHVVVIATISTFVPLLVMVAVGVIVCLKQRRKREKAQADEEARLQNEQNTAHSSFAKRGASIAAEAHMIKNSWGKCTNNIMTSNMSSPDDCSISNMSVSDDCFAKPLHQVIDGRSVYTLQRTRSQKQLNTEPGPRTSSAILAAKLQEPEYEHIKRLSVMSNSSAVCGISDASLLKRPIEKEPSSVYVIDEHFHRPDALVQGLFATEV